MSSLIVNFKKVNLYHGQILALKDINLQIREGEFVYLIGKTGSGKSSLLKALYADIPIREGEAMVSDVDLLTLKMKEIPALRRRLGIVFQDFQLLTDRSIRDNLIFVMSATGWKDKNLIESRVEDVLLKTKLENKGHKLPHQLSGGEQQRLCIARALINNPDLIIADEPTGNLDPESSAEVMELLLDINRQGKAVLMATHDYMVIQQFPQRIIQVDSQTICDVVMN